MNRSMPARDRGHRSAARGRTPGRGRAVPGLGRLAFGTPAHSAGRPQIATGTPSLATLRAPLRVQAGIVSTYRKAKQAARSRSAAGAGIADGRATLARVRPGGDNVACGPRRGSGAVHAGIAARRSKPAAAAPGGPGREGGEMLLGKAVAPLT